MSFDAYWQENKRFVARVATGVALLFLGVLVVDFLYADQIALASSRVRRLQRDLREPMYGAIERDEAEAENERLREAVAGLEARVQGARGDSGGTPDEAEGSPSNRYLRALSDARERLLLAAGRANVALEPGLGMPKLSPTRDDEIVRYMEALDAVDALARLAIDARVRRVEKIQVRLDPALSSSAREAEAVERTRVSLSVLGDSRALERVLAGTQRAPGGRVLFLESAELLAARGRERELRLDLTVVVPRLVGSSEREGGA